MAQNKPENAKKKHVWSTGKQLHESSGGRYRSGHLANWKKVFRQLPKVRCGELDFRTCVAIKAAWKM